LAQNKVDNGRARREAHRFEEERDLESFVVITMGYVEQSVLVF
jgi:hypothetical protein